MPVCLYWRNPAPCLNPETRKSAGLWMDPSVLTVHALCPLTWNHLHDQVTRSDAAAVAGPRHFHTIPAVIYCIFHFQSISSPASL